MFLQEMQDGSRRLRAFFVALDEFWQLRGSTRIALLEAAILVKSIGISRLRVLNEGGKFQDTVHSVPLNETHGR